MHNRITGIILKHSVKVTLNFVLKTSIVYIDVVSNKIKISAVLNFTI